MLAPYIPPQDLVLALTESAKFLFHRQMARWRFYLIGLIFVLCSGRFLLLASALKTDPVEVEALQSVRQALNDTGNRLNNWNKNDPCTSNWTGVFCQMDHNDSYLHVYELRLLSMNLSGKLAPELGRFSQMAVLNFMWNNLTGSIPPEIGNLTSLQLLLLTGNQISGPVPDELGNLSNLIMLNLDKNSISGPLPTTFANMTNIQHFHLNNNELSGQIPSVLSHLRQLIHLLLHNNKFSGFIPQEISNIESLKIIQLDNNNFGPGEIPYSILNMPSLVKLSLKNCRLQSSIPDFSNAQSLRYLDLSSNQLSGSIPTSRLGVSVTIIDLSNNLLSGTIPSNFSGFTHLQRLSLENNNLTGSVPADIWQNVNFTANTTLRLDFRNNSLTSISAAIDPPSNVTIRLQGNPVCTSANEFQIVKFCGSNIGSNEFNGTLNSNPNPACQPCQASPSMEYVPESPCFCALPLGVDVVLTSPSISYFVPYVNDFVVYMTSNLVLNGYPLFIYSFLWQQDNRLHISFKVFPKNTSEFNKNEIVAIMDYIARIDLPLNDTFGPYEVINFTLNGAYAYLNSEDQKDLGIRAVIGIVSGCIAGFVAISLVLFILWKKKSKHKHEVSKQLSIELPIKAASVKGFSFTELEKAAIGFSETSLVGQGGYGNVYKGILDDGTVVAIKRAKQGSLQGEREFLTEIEVLSRLHHRNLVSLVGYCAEEGEQMLVYEFMPNGSVHDLLYGRFRNPMSFAMRLHIALGSAKGIIYLHKDADPAIIHRDIKANNILLDSIFTPKVSDFGISKLAPVPSHAGGDGEVFTLVRGTPGYVDPQYILTHHLTEKSDVYSLGIVFLELLTGRKPNHHGRNIVLEVNSACQSGRMYSVIDNRMGPYSSECLRRFMALALQCCEHETKDRPSMLQIVRELEDISSMLPESETFPTDSDMSASSGSGSSGFPASSVYSRRNSHLSDDFPEAGSHLVSGVVPSIRPR